MFERMKNTMSEFGTKVNAKLMAAPVAGALVAVGSATTAFASEVDTLPKVAITEEMLSPVVEAVVANIAVILPVGLGLFAIMVGIRLIPGMLLRFLRA